MKQQIFAKFWSLYIAESTNCKKVATCSGVLPHGNVLQDSQKTLSEKGSLVTKFSNIAYLYPQHFTFCARVSCSSFGSNCKSFEPAKAHGQRTRKKNKDMTSYYTTFVPFFTFFLQKSSMKHRSFLDCRPWCSSA